MSKTKARTQVQCKHCKNTNSFSENLHMQNVWFTCWNCNQINEPCAIVDPHQ